MKLIRFSLEGSIKYGILDEGKIKELKDNYITKPIETTGKEYLLNEVKVLSPVDPGKIIIIGLNYVEHAKEMNRSLPEEPMMFMVSPTAITGHDQKVKIPYPEHITHYEAELVVVMGKEAKNVKKEYALEYVLGYSIGNDISDRDLQNKDIQFTRAKSFDTFKPIGPFIETEIDPNNVDITLRLNDNVKQDSNTNDLVFSVEELIEKVTSVMTLYPGDVIFTGTPSGVGPIKPGDKIDISIEGIGKLTNYVEESDQ